MAQGFFLGEEGAGGGGDRQKKGGTSVGSSPTGLDLGNIIT